MITDKETTELYISPLLKDWYPKFFAEFSSALDRSGIQPKYLSDTKDVWCRDYMPVQIGRGEYAQFVFDPTYLKPKKYHRFVSDPAAVCNSLDLSIRPTDIVADGGNVTRWDKKVIMTTRVIKENPKYSVHELQEAIIRLLDIDELILIPEQPYDFTGHSDGMVRFLDAHTVLINDFADEPDREFVDTLHTALEGAGLDIIEVPTSMYHNKSVKDATGIYTNYLQMKDYLFLPVFRRKEDERVLKQFEDLFPDLTILPVESNQLSKDGGVIHCVSWNVAE